MIALLNAARQVARWGARLGGLLLVAAALLTVAEVALRKAFDLSLGGMSEVSGYLLAAASAWAFGFALIDRAHLRVDVLYVHLSPRWRGLLDLLALLALAVFGGFLVWQAWSLFSDSYRFGARDLTPLRVRLEQPQFVWLAGLAFFLAVNLLLLAIAARALLTGNRAMLQRISAPSGTEEELETFQSETGTGGRP